MYPSLALWNMYLCLAVFHMHIEWYNYAEGLMPLGWEGYTKYREELEILMGGGGP